MVFKSTKLVLTRTSCLTRHSPLLSFMKDFSHFGVCSFLHQPNVQIDVFEG